MPRVELSEPPQLGPNARYRAYKPWLLEHFFDHICSYCLLRDRSVQVEHYEPSSYAPHREHDPANLLLACSWCNGPGGKGDYHPDHSSRRRLAQDATGYAVLDIRIDDFTELLRLESDAELQPRGQQRDRAAWNMALLKLDLLDEERRQVLDFAEVAEMALQSSDDEEDGERMRLILEKLTPVLVARILMLEVFGVSISERLEAHLRQHGARLLSGRSVS